MKKIAARAQKGSSKVPPVEGSSRMCSQYSAAPALSRLNVRSRTRPMSVTRIDRGDGVAAYCQTKPSQTSLDH
jgi:hypothetical protein